MKNLDIKQGRLGRFSAGKDAVVGATSPMLPFSISQNPAKDQAFAALPPVAALYSQQVKIHPEAAEILMHLHLY